MKRNIFKILSGCMAFIFLLNFSASRAAAQAPEKVRIGLISENSGARYKNASTVTVKVKGNYQVIDQSALFGQNLICEFTEGDELQIFYLAVGIQVSKNGQQVKTSLGPIVVKEVSHSDGNRVAFVSYSSNGTNTNSGRWYRGNMEFRSTGKSLVMVNELPVEEYLYGVVPREMSNSWPLEALKAQAIAARTYTVANFNKHVVEGYNLLDTPTDQDYGGYSSEGENAIRSVDETAGKIITYKGKPISAVYHSTSGGYTENNENVWTGSAIDYLRGKPDPYSTKDGLSNWSYTTTLADIQTKLVNSGCSISEIKSIKLEKYDSGRVKTVIITDESGNTVKKTGGEFGKLFNPGFYTYLNNTSFMSNFYDIKMPGGGTNGFAVLNNTGKVVNALGDALFGVSGDGSTEKLNGDSNQFYIVDGTGTTGAQKGSLSGNVVFDGHGWGHGVGMSQWGAYRMALEGKTSSDIIYFYYSGVDIEN